MILIMINPAGTASSLAGSGPRPRESDNRVDGGHGSGRAEGKAGSEPDHARR